MSTSYQPPSYAPPPKASDPLLGQSSNNNHQPGNRWDEEGESDPNDVEDFKYGVTVSQSSKDVRDAFVRKVYTILFIQLVSLSCCCSHLSRILTTFNFIFDLSVGIGDSGMGYDPRLSQIIRCHQYLDRFHIHDRLYRIHASRILEETFVPSQSWSAWIVHRIRVYRCGICSESV